MSRWTWALTGGLVFVTATALILPRIVGSSESRIIPVRADLTLLEALLGAFRSDCGRYPTTTEGLSALTSAPSGVEDRWKGPYTDQPVGHDRWNTPYVYRSDGHGYELTSLGADGQPGGEGDAADVSVAG